MHLYDASTNRLLRSYDAGRLAADGQAFLIGAFSPDSRQLAVTLEAPSKSTEPVRLLDPDTMQPTTKLDFPGRKPVWGYDVEFSADGRYLAATMLTLPLVEGDLASPRATRWSGTSAPRPTPPVRVPTGNEPPGVALSPDGRTLYTSYPLTAYDVASGKRIWERPEVDVDSSST